MEYDTCRYLAFQYKKWEKYGKELGFEKVDNRVIQLYIDEHIAEKYHDEYFAHLERINKACQDNCQSQCKGLEQCILSCEAIEEILENGK